VTEAAAWYYVSNGEKQGPLGVEQMTALLQARAITADTLVWTNGMAEWTPLGRSALATAAPGPEARPAPPAMPPSPVATSAATAAGARASAAGAAAAAAGRPAGGPAESGTGGFVADFRKAVAACLRQYATFTGRAARPEYWYFVLFNILVAIASTMLDVMIFDPTAEFSPLNSLTSLALLLPSLAVAARRLHDTDRTAWWILLFLIPVIGWLIAIFFLVQRGTPGPNRFGPPPT
jgi:uncharacterized membrane protein YhaH (DUF805 family)